MKPYIPLVLLLALSACSQTSSTGQSTSQAGQKVGEKATTRTAASSAKEKAGKRTMTACAEAMKRQRDQAMLGDALGIAGGAIGFGGRGGAVASQAASTAGSLVAEQNRQLAQTAIQRDCYPQDAPTYDEIW